MELRSPLGPRASGGYKHQGSIVSRVRGPWPPCVPPECSTDEQSVGVNAERREETYVLRELLTLAVQVVAAETEEETENYCISDGQRIEEVGNSEGTYSQVGRLGGKPHSSLKMGGYNIF